MFARVVHTDTGLETLYECHRVYLRNQQPYSVVVEFEGPGDQSVTMEIDKRFCDLYLMNHEGKTIEAYHWYDVKKDNIAA